MRKTGRDRTKIKGERERERERKRRQNVVTEVEMWHIKRKKNRNTHILSYFMSFFRANLVFLQWAYILHDLRG